MAIINTNLLALYTQPIPATIGGNINLGTNTYALTLTTYPSFLTYAGSTGPTGPTSLIGDIHSLSPGALIELFELDATVITDDNGAVGDLFRFHSGTNELNNDIVWQGYTYSAFPIEADGFEVTSSGQLPKPKIKVANIDGAVAALNRTFNDLIGAKLSRKRTLAKYLDVENFSSGNPLADTTQFFPDDIYYVNRKTSENRVFIEYELASVIDVEGVKLPRRQIIQNICAWEYRSPECSYPTAARGTITFRRLPLATETITINGTSFEFVASGASGNQINIAASLILTLDNMISVLNASVVAGVALATYTENGVDILIITHAPGDLAGDNFTLATSMPDATTSGVTLDGASGNSYWDINGDVAFTLANDVCGKKISSCKLRFGEYGVLPFGGFPGAGLF